MSMLPAINVLLFLSIVYIGSYYILNRYTQEWSAPGRGMEKLANRWPRIFQWAAIGGYATATAAWAVTGNAWIMMALGILGAAGTFMSITDFTTGKAPIEVNRLTCWLTFPLLLGIPLQAAPGYGGQFFYGMDPAMDQFLQFVLFLGIPLLFGIAWFVGAGGGGDAYGALAISYAISWWIGIGNAVWLLIAACVLQLIITFVGSRVNWDRGVVHDNVLGYKKGKARGWPFLPALYISCIVGSLIIAGITLATPAVQVVPL